MRQLSQRALQAFSTTFQLGSISSASTVMNLTQPAISRLLKDLEEDIGFPLFHRIRGRLHRTPESIIFYEELSRSFIGLDRLAQVADNIRQGHRYRLVVSALPAFANTCMARITAEFLAENPDTILTVQPLLSEEIIRRVRSYECNFGIVETQKNFPEGIEELHVFWERARCILPRHHPLGAKDIIEPADFAGQVFIQLMMAAQLGSMVSKLLAEQQIECRSIIECPLTYLVQRLVLEGVGLAIVDPRTAQLHAEMGGISRPFSASLVYGNSIIAREDQILSQIEQRYVNKTIAYLNSTKMDADLF